jgi:NAD(P)-dependent dehydrogenase (short-subunit alcohol dehydrogenase family)
VKTLLLKSIVTMSAPTARNYLITGGARGIGRGLSRILLSSGHRVCILDNNTEELDHAAALFAKSHTRGRDFEAIACNLRQPAEIRSAVGRASKLFDGKLDVLVNNAAYTAGVGAANAGNMTLEMWTASLETNLTAPMLMSQHCLPMLAKSPSRTSGGSIVNISSTRAIMSEQDNEAYATTKAGLLGLTQSMAVSLGSQGVRVNAILPGWIHVENECKDADVQGRKWEDGLSEADHAWHLTGRVGKVEDVLRAVQYLSESEGVSGTEVVVDGGVTRKMVYPEE